MFFSFFSIKSRFLFRFSSHFRFWIWSYKERKKKKGGSHSKRLLVGSFCPVCFFSWFPVSVGESIFARVKRFHCRETLHAPPNPVQRIMKDEQKEKREEEKREKEFK